MTSSKLRARILKVAGERFLQNGFHKISIDSLVAELRTSKSSIYKYFASKDALIETLVEQVHTIINQQLGQFIDHSDLGFEDKLHHTARVTGRISRLISSRFLEDLRIHTPDIWELHLDLEQQRFNQYRRLFEQGRREGLIRRDLDLDFLVTVYLQVIALSVDGEKLHSTHYRSDEVTEHLVTLFLEGALSP
jgi:AcrR family transcriptional regulator